MLGRASSWLMILMLLTCGCERLEWRALQAVGEEEVSFSRGASVFLTPSFFSTLNTQASSEQGVSLGSEFDTLTLTAVTFTPIEAEDEELILGEFDLFFSLRDVTLTPNDDNTLRVALTYEPRVLESARLRYRQGGETRLCFGRFDLKERVLTLNLRPARGDDGLPQWDLVADPSVGRISSAMVTFTPLEPTPDNTQQCDVDVDALDWMLISQSITAQLSSLAGDSLEPALQVAMLRLLGLPSGGLRVETSATGFYAPQVSALDLSTRVSTTPPWTEGSGFEVNATRGVRMSVDLGWAEAEQVDCVRPLNQATMVTPASPVQVGTLPEQTPQQARPFDVMWRLQRGVVERAISRALTLGLGCADLVIPRGPLWSSVLAVLPETTPVSERADGRLRVQPTQTPTFDVTAPTAMRWTVPKLHLEVLGDIDGILVQLASFDADLVFDVNLRVNARQLVLRVNNISVLQSGSNVSLFEDLGLDAQLDADALVAALGELLINRFVSLPLPEPLGQALDLVEVHTDNDRIEVYLCLAPNCSQDTP